MQSRFRVEGFRVIARTGAWSFEMQSVAGGHRAEMMAVLWD